MSDQVTAILVADDDPQVRGIVGAVLRNSGYEVVEACDGLEALRIARERRFDLIVSDVIMPGMRGPDLVRALRGPAEGLCRCLLISGYTDEKDCPGVPLLHKPFTAKELLGRVRQVLDMDWAACERERLEALWRAKASAARDRLKAATGSAAVTADELRARALPSPDGETAFRRAAAAEKDAAQEYHRVLKILRELMRDGKFPDEES